MVVSEDSTYEVCVFEESSGESIFSRGNDRDCISEKLRSGSSDDHLNDVLGGGDSFVPCSLSRKLNKGTADLNRNKKSNSIGSKADTPSIASRPDGGADFLIAANLGPLLQGPTLALDKNLIRLSKPKKKTCKSLKRAAPVCLPSDTGPISPGAICIKPKESISNSKKKGPIKNSSKALSKRGTTISDPRCTDEE
ncbi:hypothetical protein Ancab_018867 [Ancistrocladus abbreviatus]